MTMVLLILIAGLRYRLGADTPMYIDYFYNTVPTLDKLSLKDISIKAPSLEESKKTGIKVKKARNDNKG